MLRRPGPIVTVLMPVYNCRAFIEESVNSILNQTFTDFEFIIIDDCSTDGTLEFLKSLNDPRIRLIAKFKNSGLSSSLNMALEVATGRYIARMDGDDISLPDRFEKQIDFLEQNKEYILCGTWYKILGNGNARVIKNPEDDQDIKIALIDHCSIGHPTLMIRKSILEKNNLQYDKVMEPAEDFDLWVRLSGFGKFANLPEVLLIYREHNTQVSILNSSIQRTNANKCRIKMLGTQVQILPEDIGIVEMILNIRQIENFDSILKINKWRNTVIIQDKGRENNIQTIINKNLRNSFGRYFTMRRKWDYSILKQYLYVTKIIRVYSSFWMKLKFFIKCLIFYRNSNFEG